MPSTIIDFLYKDVTKKSKTIALCARFGPSYVSMMAFLVQTVREDLTKKGKSEDFINKEIIDLENLNQKLLSAQDPDEFLRS